MAEKDGKEAPASGIESVAEEIRSRKEDAPRRRRGRPPGSKTRKPRPRGDSSSARASKTKDEREPYQPTPEGIAVSSVLGNTVWNLSRLMTNCRALSDEEREELGAALDPVLYKYLPVLDDWKAEATLVMVAWTLYERTKPREESGSSAEVIESEDKTP